MSPEAAVAGRLSSRSSGTILRPMWPLPCPAVLWSVNRRYATTVVEGSAGLVDDHGRRTDRGYLSAGGCGLLPERRAWLAPRFQAGQCE